MEFFSSSDQMEKKDNAPKTLLELLKEEKASQIKGGIYHKIQIDLTCLFFF